ncbi:hypothetical protein N7481_004813 [Penicillium waksmanii]|uniref:uncharacterized protein n=1 Tax=Penicillium waksmanii TaxID=69791 RepID=UPI002547AC4C|nr:uncharacterized protein N7481_004813 [Penicillium waksmanii]KAJ5989603.1 hypothetical protein N7481_004813 [Penicillium waksmanii]
MQQLRPSSSTNRPVHIFNGRIDSPAFKAVGRAPWDIARYDFSIGIDTDEAIDVSGPGLDGILINAPTRAVQSHDYDHKLIGVGWNEYGVLRVGWRGCCFQCGKYQLEQFFG